jgi:LCP family protein required for cell wall assembly
LHITNRPSRADRYRQRRALYRRRRLGAVAIVAILFFACGTQAAAFVRADRGEPEQASRGTGESPGVGPADFQKSHAPAEVTTKDLVASRSQEPKKGDDSAREADPAGGQDESKLPQSSSSEPLDVLVLGVDRRPSEAENASTRSDTIMLVRVMPATGEVKLLSVPRDLYVEVQPGAKDKINSAYAHGGVEQARDVMERLTGVTVDNYVIVDFEGFEEVITAIGGVRVDVGHGVFPEKWHMGEGVQRLGGRKALFYARYRGTPRADLDRIDHQQELLAALRRQAFRWNTVTKMPGIIKTINGSVDTDLGIWQAIPLARALILHGRDGKMDSSELQGYPTYLPDGAQVLVPERKANEAILQDFRQ